MSEKIVAQFPSGHKYSCEGSKKFCNWFFAWFMKLEFGQRRDKKGRFSSWNSKVTRK